MKLLIADDDNNIYIVNDDIGTINSADPTHAKVTGRVIAQWVSMIKDGDAIVRGTYLPIMD